MERTEWTRCPVCGNKTRLQIRVDTELKNFPLYCPKCKQESLIRAKDLQITVIKGFGGKIKMIQKVNLKENVNVIDELFCYKRVGTMNNHMLNVL